MESAWQFLVPQWLDVMVQLVPQLLAARWSLVGMLLPAGSPQSLAWVLLPAWLWVAVLLLPGRIGQTEPFCVWC